MEISTAIATAIIVGLVFLILYFKFRPGEGAKCIPGPFGIPVLGFLPFLRRDVYRQFQEMSKKYGKVFKIQLGSEDVLILNGWAEIHEALHKQREIFSGRPKLVIFKGLTGGEDITSQDISPAWKIRRKFAQTALKEMGGSKSVAEIAVEEEIAKFISYFENHHGKFAEVDNMFFYPVINIIWNITSGEKLEYNHQDTKKFGRWFHLIFELMSATNILNFFPILRHFSRFYRKVMTSNLNFMIFIKKSISKHTTAFMDGNEPNDYMEAYLHKMKDNNEYFNYGHLLADAYIFLLAATETTANTLSFSLIYMSVWPEIQTKVQQEIDATIGKSRIPQYCDRKILPYTEAVLLEVQRYATVVPLSVPRKTNSSTKLCGYNIPANMEIWPNLWALHRDPELWGDPEAFRPERFLDSEGKVSKPEYLIPFSIGSRRCLGEDLAKVELFAFFTAMIQKFTFRCPLGHPPPTLEPDIGIAMRPKPYLLSIQKRL